MVASLGFEATDEQIENMVTCADGDKDGIVTFGEFKEIWEDENPILNSPAPSR